jgi:polyvinyl alcohol dehydrogenase (cytochrome)
MGVDHIETTMTSWTMRRQAAGLTRSERRAVAEFLAGEPAGSLRPPLERIAKQAYCNAEAAAPSAPQSGVWNGWGAGSANARHQPADQAGLSAGDVPRLSLKWAFGVPGVSSSGSQVTVAENRVFVGSRNGILYALNAGTGCIAWAFEADSGIRSTPVVDRAGPGQPMLVFFGDSRAQVYAVDLRTGVLRWKTRVDDHLDALITAGVAIAAGRVYVPVSSVEEVAAATPDYPCCTFRGSVAALDASTGKQIWKTHTIADAPKPTATNSAGTQVWGPSGAAIWSTPTLDTERNRLYVTTGDSYSHPLVPGSNAVLALQMDSGRIVWTRQMSAGDAWNVACLQPTGPARANCPEKAGPDFDFGSSAILTTTTTGRRVLIAGQKSGELHALDPDGGTVLWSTRVGTGGILGGIEWGFAVDGTAAYVSLSNAVEKPAGQAGGLAAVRIDDGTILWSAPPPPAAACADRKGCSTAQPAAVTSIPGIVFSGSLDGHLRAYDARTGHVVWDVDTAREFTNPVNGVAAHGGSMNGPGATVAGGMVFVTSGYATFGFLPGNALLAFSVDGR